MKNEPVLVVMAAGIGSRFGGGVKQLAKVGPAGEPIIDYSVFDAIEAGFKKVIFIIRKDIEADFKEIVGNHLESYINVEYAFQDPDDLPGDFVKPAERTKPWGTGHAILAIRDIIDSPFAVINADDYYGKEAFKVIYDYLVNDTAPDHLAMVSFVLKNTLSDNGTVTRGIARLDAAGKLIGVEETKEIIRGEDGRITGKFGGDVVLDDEDKVSMNFWGFRPEFIDELKTGFVKFLSNVPEGDIKAEYLLPDIVDKMLKEGRTTVDVLTSNDKWFGLTYAEDKDLVINELVAYASAGIYPNPLFK